MKKKKVGIWITLLVLPYVLLFMTAGAQFGTRIATRDSCGTQTSTSTGPGLQAYNSSTDLQATVEPAKCSSDSVTLVINMITILLGIAAILMILGTPVWIVMLIKASNYNHKLSVMPPPAIPTPPQPPQYPPAQQ